MLMPCSVIQHLLKKDLKLRFAGIKKKMKMVSVVIGKNPEQDSYVRIKTRIGAELGVEVEKLSLSDDITQADTVAKVREISENPTVSGIIVQQPVPSHINLQSIYDNISSKKEIEGHHHPSEYTFPLVQACMIGLWWSYRFSLDNNIDKNNMDDLPNLPFAYDEGLGNWLKKLKIAIAGRGITTGKQIAKYFDMYQIPYTQTDSQTPYSETERIYRNSDIIITGVGREIIFSKDLRTDHTILLNFGLRNKNDNNSSLAGDYNEDEIKNIAKIYTQTPGGLGPIDVICLFANLLKSCE
jgi:methylenetetrahydrofolate dehydrogenase (NADP+) / methenyltetrahydrofolate cyclohydrolase